MRCETHEVGGRTCGSQAQGEAEQDTHLGSDFLVERVVGLWERVSIILGAHVPMPNECKDEEVPGRSPPKKSGVICHVTCATAEVAWRSALKAKKR